MLKSTIDTISFINCPIHNCTLTLFLSSIMNEIFSFLRRKIYSFFWILMIWTFLNLFKWAYKNSCWFLKGRWSKSMISGFAKFPELMFTPGVRKGGGRRAETGGEGRDIFELQCSGIGTLLIKRNPTGSTRIFIPKHWKYVLALVRNINVSTRFLLFSDSHCIDNIVNKCRLKSH